MRDDMIRTQSNANTTAILGFDQLVDQLKIFSQQIVQKNNEVNRLTELCKKNNIEYSLKNEVKPQKIQPQKVSPKKV